MIIINFKNYVASEESMYLARKVSKYLPRATVCVPAVDIGYISYYLPKLKVFAQHVDYQEVGKTSGFVIPEAVKAQGAVGTLLNHSEHRLSFDVLQKTIKRCNEVGLKVILCAQNLNEARKFMKLKPYAIAFEDKKLIGSGKSITEFKSDEVRKFALMLKGSGIVSICGAGVSTAEDVLASLSLGCEGVLIASAIAGVSLNKAEKLLKELGKI